MRSFGWSSIGSAEISFRGEHGGEVNWRCDDLGHAAGELHVSGGARDS